MSTKFAVRPAPRKRPWICKRSPPCLDPDPIPNSLLLTFFMKRLQWPPLPEATASGTVLLIRQGSTTTWNGLWTSGADFFDAWFIYVAHAELGQVRGAVQLSTYNDYVFYHQAKVQPPPLIHYEEGDMYATLQNYIGWALVTA